MLKDAVKYFEGLQEKHLYELFNIAKIENIKEGSEKNFGRNIVLALVVKGELLANDGGNAKDIKPGDFLGAFMAKGEKDLNYYAKKDSSFLVIDQEVVKLLPREVILWISSQNMKLMENKVEMAHRENLSLRRGLGYFEEEFREGKRVKLDHYRAGDLIKGIINRIPKLPPFTNHLLKKISEDTLNASDISEHIKTDPAIAGLVLKTVNSAFYSLEKKVTDIHKAVLYLGMDALYQLIMNEALKKVFPEKGIFHEIHKKSSIVSFLSSALSEETGKGSPVMLSTSALFRDIGFIVRYMLERKNPKLSAMIRDMDVDVLGAVLLESWNFPDPILNLVLWQKAPLYLKPENIDPVIREGTSILYCSEVLYYSRAFKKSNYRKGPYLNSHFNFAGFEGGLKSEKLGGFKSKLVKKAEFSPLMIKNFIKEKIAGQKNEKQEPAG